MASQILGLVTAGRLGPKPAVTEVGAEYYGEIREIDLHLFSRPPRRQLERNADYGCVGIQPTELLRS